MPLPLERAGSLRLAAAAGDELLGALAKRGHQVEKSEKPVATPVMLWADAEGGFAAAGDPEAGRHAAGIADA